MSEVVQTFTAEIPTWSPYVTPVELASATPEQLAAMKITPSNKGVSPYVLTLAHDPESLEIRSPLFNLIIIFPSSDAECRREEVGPQETSSHRGQHDHSNDESSVSDTAEKQLDSDEAQTSKHHRDSQNENHYLPHLGIHSV
jgi:hypothetical protein